MGNDSSVLEIFVARIKKVIIEAVFSCCFFFIEADIWGM